MKGPIVSNATPIIAFSRINRLELFWQITGAITIPQEVEKELYEHGRPDVPALDRSNWIMVRKVKSRADVELLLPSLDKGEAEVIVLSRELGAGLVIIDELTARKVAIMMGLPIIGDDIKSQVGATITHRVLTRLFRERGVKLERTYQLNFGGNTDFYNMLERERLESKKISKTDAVTSQLDYTLSPDNIHIGPSDYVPWLLDRKWCYIRMEGRTFGDVPLNLELKMEVWDSPNSAGVVIDAIRCCKLALDRGLSGSLVGPSSYFMKSPPVQYTDSQALKLTEDFIAGGKEEVSATKSGGKTRKQRKQK